MAGLGFDAKIHESLVHLKLTQVFCNPTEKTPLEISYQFPKLETKAAIGGLTIQIGDKHIEAKVMEKQRA